MPSAAVVIILEDPFTAQPLEADAGQVIPDLEIHLNGRRVFAGQPRVQGHPLTHAYYGEIKVLMPGRLAKVQLHLAIPARQVDQIQTVDLGRGSFLRLFYDRVKNVFWIEQSSERPLYR